MATGHPVVFTGSLVSYPIRPQGTESWRVSAKVLIANLAVVGKLQTIHRLKHRYLLVLFPTVSMYGLYVWFLFTYIDHERQLNVNPMGS